MSDVIAGAVSRLSLRRLAETILRLTDHDMNEPYVNIMDLVENRIGQLLKDPNYTFRVKSKDEMGEVEGLTNPEESSIYIREDVYDRACQGIGRDRFTIAHEIGHYLLHNGVTLGLARRKPNETTPAYRDPEWQANCFAGELLMPKQIISTMSPVEIARRCGVSMQAAKIQKEKT